MNPIQDYVGLETRRHFLKSSGVGLGAAVLSQLLGTRSALAGPARNSVGGIEGIQSIAPKAKQVIFLFQSGGPSQIDTFDYKPTLKALEGTDLPDSVRMGQRTTNFTASQKHLPVAPSAFGFQQRGECGAWISDVLPHIGEIADEMCIINSIHGEAINHDPARMLVQTGSQLAGRPCMGTWVTYGLGSDCQNLPAFMVLSSIGSQKRSPQGISVRLWSSGFLPSQYQGVKLQSSGDPILYVSNPPGVEQEIQHKTLEAVSALNEKLYQQVGDPEIQSRIAQYEMAFQMQSSVPDLTDVASETEATFQLYGEDSRRSGTYARNCLLARRMIERGVRFVQLYHTDWDHHENVPRDTALLCGDIDQATSALVLDLKQRGLLDETLIIWGGEFGRTVFTQGGYKPDNFGRDHHARCFSMWLAGGGIKRGITYGRTDDFSFSPVENPVHIHDVQATILHLLGIDHTALTYRYQGRNFRLTDVHGNVVQDILA